MTFTWITFAYLVAYIIHQGTELVIEFLNARYMRDRIDRIPEHLKDHMDPESYRRAIRYNLAVFRFHIPFRLTQIAVHWFILVAGFRMVDSFLRGLDLPGIITGLLFFAVIGTITSSIDLPFSIWHDFVLEARYGFNRKTWRIFLADLAKHTLLTVILGGSLLLIMLILMDAAGSSWWIFGLAITLSFQLLLLWLGPALIMPIFHRMVPLEGDAREAVDELTRSSGFPAKEVLTMDGSKRSGHADAFFTGIGKMKKIVIYDTLLEKTKIPQLRAVLAHEIGHFMLGHIWKRIGLQMIGVFVFFSLMALLHEQPILYKSLGFPIPSDYAALVIFGIVFPELLFPFKVFFSRLSRKHEYESDAFAVRLTRDPRSLEEVLEILHETNLAAPVTHPAFAALNFTHPGLPERIAAIGRIVLD